ncbi:MAG TPA: AraC family transcriptional regulator [Stellaceae bacterium]|nr:AraC family transcriptional regulator [Stellaceae bacterium]
MHQPTTSSAWVSGIAAAIASEGLDATQLLGEAGIDFGLCRHPQQRWPTDSISHLWEIAAERSGNPAIALNMSHIGRANHYGVVGYAMMSSPDISAGLRRLVRYLSLISNATHITLPVKDGLQGIRIDFSGGARPVPRQRYEYGLVTLLLFCRWMSGSLLKPCQASFGFDVPADIAPYEATFQCPMTFNAAENVLWFPLEDLAVTLPTAMPDLADIHDLAARRNLEQLNAPHISLRAKEAISSRLPDGEPRRAQIASDLSLSERTFQRRLETEDISFRKLVSNTRHEQAVHYLLRPDLSLKDIGSLLGYSDMSAFSRACHVWFGVTPGAYRERLTGANDANRRQEAKMALPTQRIGTLRPSPSYIAERCEE